MYLLIVILALIAWAVYRIINALQPNNPPIEDMEQHLRIIQSLPNEKARRRYLKNLRKR